MFPLVIVYNDRIQKIMNIIVIIKFINGVEDHDGSASKEKPSTSGWR